jgi:hypothetical protein
MNNKYSLYLESEYSSYKELQKAILKDRCSLSNDVIDLVKNEIRNSHYKQSFKSETFKIFLPLLLIINFGMLFLQFYNWGVPIKKEGLAIHQAVINFSALLGFYILPISISVLIYQLLNGKKQWSRRKVKYLEYLELIKKYRVY